VARDLDQDAPCAAELITTLLPRPAPYMRFRIAVRCIEVWLMSDRERFSTEFAVAQSSIPKIPEQLDDPKSIVLDLLSNSRSREIRTAMVRTRPLHPRRMGPEYNVRLGNFAETAWRPDVAAVTAASLARALTRLRELKVAAQELFAQS
jgi:hypothetical protein